MLQVTTYDEGAAKGLKSIIITKQAKITWALVL